MTASGPVVPLRALGTDVDVEVRGPDPEVLEQALRDRWHLCLRTPGTPPPDGPGEEPRLVRVELLLQGHGADVDAWTRGDDDVRDSDPRRLLHRLTQAVTHQVISARTGDLLMLHAAGLAHPATGASAVFVAPGNTGKTTLCLTLGPALSYLTDETVGMGRDGTLALYPKPLSVRRPDWQGVKDETAPGDAGLALPAAQPWLAGVVLLDRQDDHPSPPRVEELDLLDAVLALTPESSGFMRTRAPLRRLADALERTGGARRVTYREVTDLEPLAAAICSRESPW